MHILRYTLSLCLTATAVWPLFASVVHAGDWRVVDPVPKGAQLIQSADDHTIDEHLVARINERFPDLVERSEIDPGTLDWDTIVDLEKLDVRRPVRFSLGVEGRGFTVPAVLRAYVPARMHRYDGKMFFPDEKGELRVALIVLRKLPVYSHPEDAYAEVEGWNEALAELGYERLNLAKVDSREEFLEQAHSDVGDHLGSNYPAFTVAAWRHGHTGILLSMQRSPHPERDGREAHGFNVGISIFDTRVKSYFFDALRADDAE